MTDTKTGGKKAASNAKLKYGKDFFRITGKRGGNLALLKEKTND